MIHLVRRIKGSKYTVLFVIDDGILDSTILEKSPKYGEKEYPLTDFIEGIRSVASGKEKQDDNSIVTLNTDAYYYVIQQTTNPPTGQFSCWEK